MVGPSRPTCRWSLLCWQHSAARQWANQLPIVCVCRGWRTFKRPGVDDFIRSMAQYYELVVYTSQLPTYADPILDRLDPQRMIQYRWVRCGGQGQGGGRRREEGDSREAVGPTASQASSKAEEELLRLCLMFCSPWPHPTAATSAGCTATARSTSTAAMCATCPS